MQQIKYYVAVVNCRSFTEAAEQCFITQSAISQQIKALEKELGVKLIQREKRKFQLTPAGDYFYQNCYLLLNEFDRLKSETIQINRLSSNKLRVGCLSSYNGKELLEATNSMLFLHNDLLLDIVTGSHEELYDMIHHDNIDIAFNDVRHNITDDYNFRQLVDSKCFVAVSRNLPQFHCEHVDVQDLRKIPCIVIANETHQEGEKRFYQYVWNIESNYLFAKNIEEAMLMVMSNKGYLPIDFYAANCSRYNGYINCIPLFKQQAQLSRSYAVFWKKNQQNIYINGFVDILASKFSPNPFDSSTQITDFH